MIPRRQSYVLPALLSAEERGRWRILVAGAVQGIGFRPFIYRLAMEEGLAGSVCNTPNGVQVEIEGRGECLLRFVDRLQSELPPHAELDSVMIDSCRVTGETEFRIVTSTARGAASVVVQPDLATCPKCLAEILDPKNRRYRYPFTNCTHCGPRYSIIQGLPYDRGLTTMRAFVMCSSCRSEYEDPMDRRFHAQPNACPACGPQLEYWAADGTCKAGGELALLVAAEALRQGRILAVKGIGGFHLMADARNEGAIAELRARKRRPHKPFAVMAECLESAPEIGRISPTEEEVLLSAAAPILLLEQTDSTPLAPSVAPGNPLVGLMLPHAPLQHLLMRELGFPIVATSGNLTDEPICVDEREAAARLQGIADAFLVHNRPIARPLDDSVVRVLDGAPVLLRVGRGYAPVRVPVRGMPAGLLATGAHQKCTVSLSVAGAVVTGQHLGDMDSVLAAENHRTCVAKLSELYGVAPRRVATDLHPDYTATRFGVATGLPRTPVQHHYAHVLGCLAENNLQPPALGVSWDGTGLGTDGTVWGGEFLHVTTRKFLRLAHLRTFPLPGGDAAARDPRRACYGLLHELRGEEFANEFAQSRGMLASREARMLGTMLRQGINSPRCSSMGRFFDAVSVLLGLAGQCSFEGQAAMALEFAAMPGTDAYPIDLVGGGEGVPMKLDWEPLISALLAASEKGASAGQLAGRFHESLARAIVTLARFAGEPRVVLTGGCFQNELLLRRAVVLLREAGFEPVVHRRVPPNDNGISLGQVVAGAGELWPEEY